MEQPSKNEVQENFDASYASTASSAIDSQNGSNSLYDSAMESASEYKSFKNTTNTNNNSTLSENNYNNFDGYSSSSSSSMNLSLSAADNVATLNDTLRSGSSNRSEASINSSNRSEKSHKKHNNNNADASTQLIQSESTETNASQEDVDPKSQLANKTIFKSDNPNLSIIEISDVKDSTELENSVLVLEEPKDFEKHASSTPSRRSPSTVSSSASASSSGVSSSNNLSLYNEYSVEKRRKKPESLLQSSRQKLNVDIAEASAKDTKNSTEAGAAGDECMIPENDIAIENNSSSRREIKIYDTLEEFEQNLPSTVTILDTPFGSKVYLVGTAHFSEESQDDVSFVIRNVRPDVVMVELCPSRIHMLKLDERTLLEEAKNINLSKIRSIVQTHGYITGVFFIMLLQMSAQTTKDLGMAPGGEFRRAFEEIQRLPGCMLHLGDRPIRITLIRALRALSFWQTIKLGLRLISSETISIEEVEECKKKDLLEKLMEEMAGEFPAFSDVFVRERDMFLCHSLQVAALPQSCANGLPRPMRVVGIVGIGHAKGIAKMWGCVDPRKIPEIMEIPPASLSTRIGTFTLKYGLIGLALFGAFKILRPRVSALF